MTASCFRPLIGVIISKLRNLVGNKEVHQSFRPLIGVIISKQGNYYIEYQGKLVSVPLSGLLFLNAPIELDGQGYNKLFPSPYRGYYF